MTTVTQLHHLSPATSTRAGFDHDYYDVFVARSEAVRHRTAEECARAVEGTAGLGGIAIWQGVLQLRPEPREARHLRSWAVVDAAEDWLTLGSRSWALTARVVLEVDDDQLKATTMIRYDTRVGRAIWTPLSAVHRHLMPGLLRGTVHLLGAQARESSVR